MGTAAWLVLAGAAFFAFAGPARADDPSLLSFGVGWFDFNRKKNPGVELRFEYRSDYKIPYIQAKPFAAIGGATSGHGFLGAGILWDVYLGRRFVVTPSFAPHIYVGGNSKLDLGYVIEFRSQIEIAYRFDDRSRLGVAVSHYSNAGLGKDNPGAEILSLYYTVPVDKLF
ncbi:MAG TPA: acyloxyacyl hydrolase [Alphaproteobacteria bacterium]|nr:acyloxyacyl hydrolase [Alphaproteobacteria bacterium]